MLRKISLLFGLIALLASGCSLTSQQKAMNLKLAISGGVYGELEPCG